MLTRIKFQIARIYLWTGLVVSGYALKMFVDRIEKEEP